MKKTFNNSFLILWLAVIYSQLISMIPNQKLVLSPISFSVEKIYTGLTHKEIISNLSMKLVIEEKVSVRFSSVKKEESTYSPRVITETISPLDKEQRRQKKVKSKKPISYLKVLPKKINFKNEKIFEASEVQEIVYNEINVNENDEINTKNLIKHYGFKINKHEKISWSSLLVENNIGSQLKKLAAVEKQKRINDLASAKKLIEDKEKKTRDLEKEAVSFQATLDHMTVDRKIANTEKLSDEEPVLFDYSESEKEKEMVNQVQEIMSTEDAPIAEVINEIEPGLDSQVVLTERESSDDDKSISKMVKSVIAREMNNIKLKPVVAYHAPIGPKNVRPVYKEEKPEVTVNTQRVGSGYSYLAPSEKKQDKKEEDLVQSALAAPQKVSTQSGNSRTVLSASEISFGKREPSQLQSFEFATAHDLNNRLTDDGTGFINLDMNLSGTHSIFRGTILKRGMMRTIVNLILGPGTMSVEVPIFSQQEMTNLLTELKIDGRGGFVLVELDDQIDTLDIDTNYEAKILYDGKFRKVDSMSDATYLLYLGVAPGNTLLKIKTVNSHYAEKVIHIIEDEVLVEMPFIVDPEEQKLVLMERNILAKDKKELEISGSEITFFNRKIKAVQEALNLFSIKLPALVMGMRKYFEFSHLGETLYLGTWSENEVEVPSRDFIENVLATLDVDNLKGRCLIQVNLNKEIKDIKVGGDTIKGPMNIQMSFLDQDGTMSDEVSELVRKAFFVGEMQGLINIEIDYLDHSKEYLQTFCSDETYLVEQL